MYYAGIDHHAKTSTFTVLDAEGHLVDQKMIPTTREHVQTAFSAYPEPVKVVLEAGYSWGKMFDWLTEVADQVVLAHPYKVRAIAEARRKTDKIDSETLAYLLRADLIPEAYACTAEARSVKRVLRHRLFAVKVQTMVKNRIFALVHQHDLARPDVTDLFGKVGMAWLSSLDLPEPDSSILTLDLGLLSTARGTIAASDGLLLELSRGDERVLWLRSIPGIGEFFSVLIRTEVDDIHRFRTPEKFVSYTGLAPSTYSSGGKTRHGPITKEGNKYLRWAYVEAVYPAVRKDASLRSFYERIKKRRGAKDAKVATARKLAVITWHILKEQRFYELR